MSFGLYQEDALMDKDKYECTIGQEMIGTAAYAHDRCFVFTRISFLLEVMS